MAKKPTAKKPTPRAAKKAGRGGSRAGAGRPLDGAGKKVPRTLWLDPAEIGHLEALGGTVSEGLRLLLKASMDA